MASVSRNIEIKATVKSLENLIKKAKELSESSGLLLNQEDTFFTVPHGRLKLRSEIVLTKDQSPEDGQIIANTLMDKLGIAKEDLISGAYMDLLLS